ncbi:MAG: rod shape-determining protein MreC [Gemmatimonadota bacterium]
MARATRSGNRIDLALLASCALLAVVASALPPSPRAAISGWLQQTLASPLYVMKRSSERARAAFRDKTTTAARIDSLALRVNELSALEQENARLRQLLLLGQRLRTGFVPAEALHAQDGGEAGELLITAGAGAGVREGSAVVATEGVVGLITHVSRGTSQAITWTHHDFRASAMAVDGAAFGIVMPATGDGPERYLLQLRGVPYRDALKPGTLITTSGLGGVFPRGIPIGVVLDEVPTTEQWSRTYLLRPAVKPQDVSSVIVLSPQWVSGNTSSVWSTAATVDSAVRRIVAAGDSIARREAEERAARQQALDSATALLAAPPVAPVTPRTGTDTLGQPPPRLATPPIVPGARRDTTRRPTPQIRRDTIGGA